MANKQCALKLFQFTQKYDMLSLIVLAQLNKTANVSFLKYLTPINILTESVIVKYNNFY